MQLQLIRIATPVICLAGILALICLLAGAGVGKSPLSELVFIVPYYLGPFIVLAFLGYQGTKSRALAVILLVIATLSTALWIYITFDSLEVLGGHMDAQTGMGISFLPIVHWFIVLLAILAFVPLHKR